MSRSKDPGEIELGKLDDSSSNVVPIVSTVPMKDRACDLKKKKKNRPDIRDVGIANAYADTKRVTVTKNHQRRSSIDRMFTRFVIATGLPFASTSESRNLRGTARSQGERR